MSDINLDFLPDLDFNRTAEFDQVRYTSLNPTIDVISKGKQMDAMSIGIEESPQIYRKGGQ